MRTGTETPITDLGTNGRIGHPPGLYLLFVPEMWDRFSSYEMKAFLILYITAPLRV